MIRHLVTFQLAHTDEPTRQRHAREMKQRLEALLDVVPGVERLEVHFDLGHVASHWPVVLVSDFASVRALDAYQTNAHHLEVVAWMNDGVITERSVVDYEF